MPLLTSRDATIKRVMHNISCTFSRGYVIW
jgi:hypothetical protein